MIRLQHQGEPITVCRWPSTVLNNNVESLEMLVKFEGSYYPSGYFLSAYSHLVIAIKFLEKRMVNPPLFIRV